MSKLTIKVLTLAGFMGALVLPAFADGGGGGGGGGGDSSQPPPPASSGSTNNGTMTKKKNKKSEMEFIQGYRQAYATIYERNDYRTAIDELRALKHDDHADVANLIGYSYRKLGDYDQSKVWYEAALKADPNHVRTWQYYGLWQVEQGHREQAEADLKKIGSICGATCPEYRSLAEALDITARGGHAVY
jgi:tetratricopeptide (TPR) repeat protein